MGGGKPGFSCGWILLGVALDEVEDDSEVGDVVTVKGVMAEDILKYNELLWCSRPFFRGKYV